MSSPFVHSHPATHGGTPCSTPSPFPPPLPQAAYPPYADEDDLAPTPASLAISHLPLSDLAACYVDGGVGLQAAVVFDHFRRLDGNNSGCDAGGCGGHSHGHGHAPSPADAVAATFAGSFTMPPVDPDALAAEARAHEAVRRRFPPAIAQELIQSVRAGEYSRLHMMGMSAPDAAAAANATAASSSTPRLSAHSTHSPGAPESDAGLSRGHSFSGMSTRAPSPQSGGFYSRYSSYSSYPGRVDEDESVDTLSPLRREGGSLPRADYGHQSNQNNHIPAHYYNQEQQLAKQQQLSRPVLVFPSLASALRFRDTASQAANEAAHLLDVLDHFAAYARMATAQLRREAHKVDQVEWKYKALLGGMSEKFEHRLECVKKNQEFLNEIIKNQTMADTRMDYAAIRRLLPPDRRLPNFDKVQAALKQCVRDWSVAGASEREEAYMPILKYLRDNFANPGDHKVLIPGTGLSRLHFEIARLGFQSHAIEFSYYMLLPAFYMLNCVDRPAQWQVYPWVLSTCNLRSSATRTKPVYIPDIACSNVPLSPVAFDGLSMLAGDFLEVVDGISNAYDSVVTCFFIDTAHNVLEYIRCISRILKPGGKWVNFGPLLYHYADMDGQPSLELAWDEIKSTLISFGLALDHESHGHKAHYCSPPESFASSGYNCVFSVCTKIEDTSQSSGWAPDVLAALDGAVTVGAAAAKVASGEGPTTAAVEAAKVEAAAILAAMASADAAAAKAAAAVEAAETEAEAKAAAGSNGRGRGSGRGRGNGARNAHNAGPRGGKKAQ